MRQPPRPVRLASWLIALCAVLSLVDAIATLVVLRHFDTVTEQLMPGLDAMDSPSAPRVLDGRTSLLNTMIVGFGTAVALTGLYSAIRRRSPRVRLVAGTAMGVVALFLTCGIAAGPEALVSPSGLEPPELRRLLDRLLPLWFSVVHGLVVTVMFAAMIAVAILLTKEDAREFHSVPDRTVRWLGFTSWLHIRTGRTPGRSPGDRRRSGADGSRPPDDP